jgi:hypothetical protein
MGPAMRYTARTARRSPWAGSHGARWQSRDSRMRCDPEVLVLLSGGVDSAAIVAFYLEFGRPPAALFVNYAQPAHLEEERAATAVAAHFGIPLSVATWTGPTRKGIGLILGRNLLLLAAGLMERPPSVSVLALGLHAGLPMRTRRPSSLRPPRPRSSLRARKV